MMLGFRALKNESRAFKICFFISAAQTALLIFYVIINASVLRAAFESSSAFTVLKVISAVLKFIILCCQTAGIYDLQEKAGMRSTPAVRRRLLSGMCCWCFCGLSGDKFCFSDCFYYIIGLCYSQYV